MKRVLIGMLIAQGCVLAARGAWNDRLMRCATAGPDRYADGARVRDGECYALVHTRTGCAFAGFNADGTCISTNSEIVAVAPIARDGRCPRTLFQIPKAYADAHAGGTWTLCLLDTRRADGVPAGVDRHGALQRVNRWGVAARLTGATMVKAGHAAALPRTALPPRISAIRVKDGRAALTVEDTMPYLSYEVVSARGPEMEFEAGRAGPAAYDGSAARPVVMEAEAPGEGRFYRIRRKEP